MDIFFKTFSRDMFLKINSMDSSDRTKLLFSSFEYFSKSLPLESVEEVPYSNMDWIEQEEFHSFCFIVFYNENFQNINKFIEKIQNSHEVIKKEFYSLYIDIVLNCRSVPGLMNLEGVFIEQEAEKLIVKMREYFQTIYSLCAKDKVFLRELFQDLQMSTTLSKGRALCYENVGTFDLFNEASDCILKSRLRINILMINRLQELLDDDLANNEEVFHVYLKENLIFLDSLAKEVVSKGKLGKEYVTDFLIKRFDGLFIVVEIEDPKKKMFNQRGDFSSEFTQAFGQVLDFQRWVRDNAAYSFKSLDGVVEPKGLLIMGRNNYLTSENKKKLEYFKTRFKDVDVLTYDDILERAKVLLKNIYT